MMGHAMRGAGSNENNHLYVVDLYAKYRPSHSEFPSRQQASCHSLDGYLNGIIHHRP